MYPSIHYWHVTELDLALAFDYFNHYDYKSLNTKNYVKIGDIVRERNVLL